jgi:hypothetical protein
VAASLLSVVVALAVGLEGFFHWTERWMRYRQTAELLKTQGWQYLNGVGAYERDPSTDSLATHFGKFATNVENAIHRDVLAFSTTIAQEPTKDGDRSPTH